MADGVEDDVMWNDKGVEGEGVDIPSSSGEMQQTCYFDSRNGNFSFASPEDTSMSSYFKSPEKTTRRGSCEGAGGCKEGELARQGGSIGLKLSMTPAFINLLETKLNETTQRKPSPSPSKQEKVKVPMTDKEEKLDNEKLKASNFPAEHLKIGNWERNSIHEGHLVAKCYYKKGRLVWEVLEGALKSKIEIQWSDIIGIRARKADDGSGILEIELNEKPLFFKETNPQPRKHTLWQQADDFTGGEALIYRRHYVKFGPGILDKHYERLLQYDQRLFVLSRSPFPSKQSPFFPNAFGLPESSLDFNGYRPHIHPMLQYPYYQNFPASMASPTFQNVRPTTRPQFAFMDSNPTMPVSNNVMLDNQNMAFLNEATNIAGGNYGQVARTTRSAVPNHLEFQNFPNMGFQNQDLMNAITHGQGTRISPTDATLPDLPDYLVGHDMQAMNETVLARASPMCSSLLPLQVAGGRTINEQAIQNVEDQSSILPNGGLLWPDSNWLPQYNGVQIIQPSTNTSFYPYGLPNQPNGGF